MMRKRTKFALPCLLVLLSAWGYALELPISPSAAVTRNSGQRVENVVTGYMSGVADGDTFYMTVGGKLTRMRLAIVDAQAINTQRALLKRKVRDVANSARSLAAGLRRRMNAMNVQEAAARERRADSEPSGEAAEEGVPLDESMEAFQVSTPEAAPEVTPVVLEITAQEPDS